MYFILHKELYVWRVYIHDADLEPYFTDQEKAERVFKRLVNQAKGKVQYKLVRVVGDNSSPSPARKRS